LHDDDDHNLTPSTSFLCSYNVRLLCCYWNSYFLIFVHKRKSGFWFRYYYFLLLLLLLHFHFTLHASYEQWSWKFFRKIPPLLFLLFFF
jgi:hypothetical protein